MIDHLVVVGASLAGLRAAEAARKSGFSGKLTLIGAEPHLPYDRPPLSKAYLDASEPVDDLAFRSEDTLRTELGIDLVLGVPAAGLDTAARQVLLADGSVVPYDAVVLATGAQARTIPSNLSGVHTLRTLDDAAAIRAAMDRSATTVVIGAGFIGSEIASGARKRGLKATVVEALPTPLVRSVGEQMGERLASLHVRNGTDLRCGVGIDRIVGEGSVESVVLTDGTEISAELVVVGIGASPGTDWLAGSGLTLDNGIVCDEAMFTGIDGVYAAGDVARWYNPTFSRHMRLEHWTSAAEQGACAARNALDPANSRPYSTVPYFWSDWYDVRIQFVGVPQCDEILVVEDELETRNHLVALYRAEDRLVGALTVNGQADIMKYRGQIMKQTPWDQAVEFAANRRSARHARA